MRGNSQHGLSFRSAMLFTMMSIVNVGQCAVPFSSAPGENAPFLAPLLLIIALAYFMVRVIWRATTKRPSGPIGP